MGWGDVFTGVLGIGTSIFDSYQRAESARDANASNMEINREQLAFNERMAGSAQNFSERMANTQWQRGVADMKAAGINPMFAASQGGASSPSGVAASAGSLRSVEPVPPVASTFLSNAKDLAKLYADVKKTLAETRNTNADTAVKVLQAPNVSQDTKLKAQQAATSAVSARATEATIPGKVAKSKTLESEAEFSWLHNLMKVISPVASTALGLTKVGTAYNLGKQFLNIRRRKY